MIHQLYHVGQHGDADNSFAPNWSPSGLPSYHDADGSHAMTTDEIEDLIEGFVRAAMRAQASGFDGVEIFAAYHAVVDQFWTPWSNRRTDDWGGSFENRMRFSSEILRRIRRALRRRLHRRAGGQRGPWVPGDAVGRCAVRRRRLARRASPDGLRDLRDRLLLRLPPDHPAVPVRAAARRAVRGGSQGCRAERARPGREPHPNARRRRGGPCGRSCRHGQHRPWPDRGSAPGREGPRGAPRRGPAVHLLQPAVLGSAVARLLDLVSRQPVGGTRVRVGRRPIRAGGSDAPRPRRRWRTGRVGGGPCRR